MLTRVMASAHGNGRMQSAALKPSGSSARPQHPANQTRMTNGYYGKTAMASVHMTSRTQSAALQAAATNTGPQRVAWTKKGMRPWPYNHPAKNQGQRHVRLPANREEPMEVDPPQDAEEPMDVDLPPTQAWRSPGKSLGSVVRVRQDHRKSARTVPYARQSRRAQH